MQLTSQSQTLGYGKISTVIVPAPPAEIGHVPEVPVTQLYKHMINTGESVHSFTFNKDDVGNPSLIWTTLMHPGKYIGTIGMIFTVLLCKAVSLHLCFTTRTV